MNSDCDHLRRVLSPYLDGELAPAAQAEGGAHLAVCPDCAALVRHHRRLADEIRQAMAGTAPVELRLRLAADWHRRRLHRRLGFGLAAAALLAITLGLTLGRGDGLDDDELREVADLHHRSLLPGHLTEIAGTDSTALAAWFRDRLTFAPWVAGLADPGYQLVGARLDWCEQQRVAALVFHRQDHVINLVSYPAERPGEVAPALRTRDGLAVCGWVRGQRQYIAVSDLPGDEVRRFATLVCETIAQD